MTHPITLGEAFEAIGKATGTACPVLDLPTSVLRGGPRDPAPETIRATFTLDLEHADGEPIEASATFRFERRGEGLASYVVAVEVRS